MGEHSSTRAFVMCRILFHHEYLVRTNEAVSRRISRTYPLAKRCLGGPGGGELARLDHFFLQIKQILTRRKQHIEGLFFLFSGENFCFVSLLAQLDSSRTKKTLNLCITRSSHQINRLTCALLRF